MSFAAIVSVCCCAGVVLVVVEVVGEMIEAEEVVIVVRANSDVPSFVAKGDHETENFLVCDWKRHDACRE
jgi:pentatricopeptide repeat protein